ncbi:unnamed protein product [Caenorhabditis nigoni]
MQAMGQVEHVIWGAVKTRLQFVIGGQFPGLLVVPVALHENQYPTMVSATIASSTIHEFGNDDHHKHLNQKNSTSEIVVIASMLLSN